MIAPVQGFGPSTRESSQVNDARILVADDEDVIRSLLTEILSEEGFKVVTASDGKEALEVLENDSFDLIISDMVMPNMNGIELLQAAFRIDPEYAIIMITGYPSVDTAVKLVNMGAADYITKPFNVDLIKVTVAKVLELRKSRGGASTPDAPKEDAGIDKVTGAYNSTLFSKLLETEVKRSIYRSHEIGLLTVVMDTPEDAKALADALFMQARPGDIVGRLGDSILAIMLPESNRDDVDILGQHVRSAVQGQFSIGGGIACLPSDANDNATLMQVALTAANAAKSQGGNAILLPQ